MRLIFTRRDGKFDALEVQRPGRTPERIECPKQRIIPHEMVHYAVEHTLLARGFLRRIAEGEAVQYRMVPDADSDAVERLVEVFQGDGWSGGGTSAADMIALYHVTCTERACAPLPVDTAVVEAVRAGIADLSARWHALPVGGVLSLEL
jgi:hypothetical protein